MNYQFLIFDVDGTLLNFSRAYANAQQAVAKALEIEFSSEFVQTDEELGWKLCFLPHRKRWSAIR